MKGYTAEYSSIRKDTHDNVMRRAHRYNTVDPNLTEYEEDLIETHYLHAYEVWKRYRVSYVVHHIIPLKQGGKHSYENLISMDGREYILLHNTKANKVK